MGFNSHLRTMEKIEEIYSMRVRDTIFPNLEAALNCLNFLYEMSE